MGSQQWRTLKVRVARTWHGPSANNVAGASRVLTAGRRNRIVHCVYVFVRVEAHADVDDFVRQQVTAELVGGGQTRDLGVLMAGFPRQHNHDIGHRVSKLEHGSQRAQSQNENAGEGGSYVGDAGPKRRNAILTGRIAPEGDGQARVQADLLVAGGK